jgi:50S ribosomal protein L16 3-hydroxylase
LTANTLKGFKYSRRFPGVAAGRHNPFRIANSEQIFCALLELAARLKENDFAIPFRFFKSGVLIRNTFPYRALKSDRTFEGYLERIQKKLHGGEFGIVINQFQALDPHIFAGACDFLSTIFQKTGIPPGGASMEFFCGNYRLTPFGVHKDEQEVITFVLSGTKRFLLWPFDTLRKVIGAPKSARERAFLPRRKIDITAYRKEALVIEGNPGDLLYWPKEWWHVAESDGSVTTTLSLGIFPTGDPMKQLSKASYDLWREGFGIRNPYRLSSTKANPEINLELHVERSRKQLDTKRLQQRMKENMLSFLTGSGFHEIPATLEHDRSRLTQDYKLCLTRPGALSWFRKDESLICVGANGRLFDCPSHPKLLRLLKRFISGDLVSVQQATRECVGRSETKDAIYLLNENDLTEILCKLVNCGALRIA